MAAARLQLMKLRRIYALIDALPTRPRRMPKMVPVATGEQTNFFLFFQKLFIKSLSNCSPSYEDYFILLPKSSELRINCGFSSMCSARQCRKRVWSAVAAESAAMEPAKTCMVCGGSRICSHGVCGGCRICSHGAARGNLKVFLKTLLLSLLVLSGTPSSLFRHSFVAVMCVSIHVTLGTVVAQARAYQVR